MRRFTRRLTSPAIALAVVLVGGLALVHDDDNFGRSLPEPTYIPRMSEQREPSKLEPITPRVHEPLELSDLELLEPTEAIRADAWADSAARGLNENLEQRRIRLSQEMQQRQQSRQTEWRKSNFAAFRDADGTPLLTNTPELYRGRVGYEELELDLQPISTPHWYHRNAPAIPAPEPLEPKAVTRADAWADSATTGLSENLEQRRNRLLQEMEQRQQSRQLEWRKSDFAAFRDANGTPLFTNTPELYRDRPGYEEVMLESEIPSISSYHQPNYARPSYEAYSTMPLAGESFEFPELEPIAPRPRLNRPSAFQRDEDNRSSWQRPRVGEETAGSGDLFLNHNASSTDDEEPSGRYLGNLSRNRYAPDSTGNEYGAGSPYNPNSVTNPYGPYGSAYSNRSANNPYATNAPRLYDSEGNYRGRISANPYDPESTSNPYGRYGSPYSPDSVNNPYGAGSPYRSDSPNNPYGTGLRIVGDE